MKCEKCGKEEVDFGKFCPCCGNIQGLEWFKLYMKALYGEPPRSKPKS